MHHSFVAHFRKFGDTHFFLTILKPGINGKQKRTIQSQTNTRINSRHADEPAIPLDSGCFKLVSSYQQGISMNYLAPIKFIHVHVCLYAWAACSVHD